MTRRISSLVVILCTVFFVSYTKSVKTLKKPQKSILKSWKNFPKKSIGIPALDWNGQLQSLLQFSCSVLLRAWTRVALFYDNVLWWCRITVIGWLTAWWLEYVWTIIRWCRRRRFTEAAVSIDELTTWVRLTQLTVVCRLMIHVLSHWVTVLLQFHTLLTV